MTVAATTRFVINDSPWSARKPRTRSGASSTSCALSPSAAFPPLGLAHRRRHAPADWELKLVDLNVDRLKDEDLRWADYVMISAMIVHKQSVHEIVARCAALQKPVIAGGPLFTTGHEAFPAIPHFVLGEAEDIMPQLVADMRAGPLQPHLRRRAPGPHAGAGAALGPDRFEALRHDGRPVLARLPLSTASSATSSS